MRKIGLALVVAAACSGASSPTSTKDKAAPVSVAIVYCGWELWIGNDQLLPAEDPSRYPGVLGAMKTALDQADLAHAMPPGSQGMLIEYSNQASVRVPLGPIANLTGAALGTQKDYYGTQGSELVRGVTLAVDQLEKAPAGKKQLIVLSDGNDTNNEAAKVELVKLKQRVHNLGIEVTSIIYKTAMSDQASVIAALTDHTTTAPTAGSVTTDLVHAIGRPGA